MTVQVEQDKIEPNFIEMKQVKDGLTNILMVADLGRHENFRLGIGRFNYLLRELIECIDECTRENKFSEIPEKYGVKLR